MDGEKKLALPPRFPLFLLPPPTSFSFSILRIARKKFAEFVTSKKRFKKCYNIVFLHLVSAQNKTNNALKALGESHSRDKSSSTLLLRSLSSTAEQSQPEAQAIIFRPRGEGMRRCGYHHGCRGRGCHPNGVNACVQVENNVW